MGHPQAAARFSAQRAQGAVGVEQPGCCRGEMGDGPWEGTSDARGSFDLTLHCFSC